MGAPRIDGELLKLGIDIGEASVGKCITHSRKPPSQDWRTLLENVKTIVSVDFFTVPTIRFQVLCVFLVLSHDQRRIVHFNVTAHPTAEWTTQQLREAFPLEQIPRYLLRDRERIFGSGEYPDTWKNSGTPRAFLTRASQWRANGVQRVRAKCSAGQRRSLSPTAPATVTPPGTSKRCPSSGYDRQVRVTSTCRLVHHLFSMTYSRFISQYKIELAQDSILDHPC
jgi:hypothetical protein